MEFTELSRNEQVNLLKQYLGQYLKGMRRLRYLQSELDSIPILKAVQYTGMPRGTDTGNPVQVFVFKYNNLLRRVTAQQEKVLKVESNINDIFDLLDDTTRLIFEAVYFDDYSYDHIASVMGCNKRTIIRTVNSGIAVMLSNSMVIDRLKAYYNDRESIPYVVG